MAPKSVLQRLFESTMPQNEPKAHGVNTAATWSVLWPKEKTIHLARKATNAQPAVRAISARREYLRPRRLKLLSGFVSNIITPSEQV